jgi:hypothetical protein
MYFPIKKKFDDIRKNIADLQKQVGVMEKVSTFFISQKNLIYFFIYRIEKSLNMKRKTWKLLDSTTNKNAKIPNL